MRTLAAGLVFLCGAAIGFANDSQPCDAFKDGAFTTVKELEFFGKVYCIGWSELPMGAEVPAGQVPTPLHVLKPYEWTVGVLPTGKEHDGLTEYQLVFKANFLTDEQDVTYAAVVTHAEPFTVRHVAAATGAGAQTTGRVDLKSLRDFQAALSEVTQELRAIETIAPSIRAGLDEMLGSAAQMSGEWFERDTANAHPTDQNPNSSIQFLRDTLEEFNRTDSALRSEKGIKELEARILARAEADVSVARELVKSRFLALPIDFNLGDDASAAKRGTLEARQLIGLCERWGISFSEEVKEILLGESDGAQVRAMVFDQLWPHVIANRPRLDQRPAGRATFLIEAALSERVGASLAGPESRINRILDEAVLTNTSRRQIDFFFYPNLVGLPSMLALYQIHPYRLHATALGHHVASAVEKGD